jgi:hypothetical protein
MWVPNHGIDKDEILQVSYSPMAPSHATATSNHVVAQNRRRPLNKFRTESVREVSDTFGNATFHSTANNRAKYKANHN